MYINLTLNSIVWTSRGHYPSAESRPLNDKNAITAGDWSDNASFPCNRRAFFVIFSVIKPIRIRSRILQKSLFKCKQDQVSKGKVIDMPASVLVGYATRYGSTQEVAEAVAAGFAVDILPLQKVRDLTRYNAVVLGAPLFMFHWHKDALNFLSRHQKALMERYVAIFALGPVHDPHDEQEWRDANSHLTKELEKFSWLKPVALEMFGGKYDPAKLRFPLNLFAGAEPASDIRDWTAIRTWASHLAGKLHVEKG
jgi:menaquinone-dependent protoporphyrinogen oxidase